MATYSEDPTVPSPFVPPAPYSIADDSRMSEDYLLTDDILIDASSPNPLAAVPMPGVQWTALAVVSGRGLVHVVPDQNSQSGWDLVPVPSGGAATEVVAVGDGTNTGHIFYADGTQSYHSSLGAGGTWSTPDVLPPATGLAATNVPLTNEPVAVGVTADGDLLLIRKNWTTGQWQGTVIDMAKGLAGAQVVLKMVDFDNWTLAAVVEGKLQFYSGRDTTVASTQPYVVPTSNTVTRIHFAYQRTGSTMVMFSDDQNALHTSFGFTDQVSAIPNSTVVQGAGVVDTAMPPRVHFYGVDPTGKLWVLHQTAWDADAPVWAPIFPLDTNVATVASPQSALAAARLFAVGADQTLHALVQDQSTQLWTRNVVQQPGQKPYSLTRYRTRLLVTDANGNPAPGVPVTIGASLETAILVGGSTYFIGPGTQTATVATDATGVLTISRTATSLVSPSYVVSVPNSGPAKTVAPDGNYHAFLSGKASINTASAVIPPMSRDTLVNAQVGGQPLAPGVTADKAGTASSAIINGMNSAPGNASAFLATGHVGWSLSAEDPDHPVFQYHKTRADLVAHLQTLGPAGVQVTDAGGADAVGSAIADFFGDVLHAIETFAMEVVDWVVNVVDSLINLVVKVADEIIHLAAIVIRSIEDAIPFIHAIFAWIGALVEKVLDWIKDLFGWGDIWNTKLVFEHLVTTAISALEWAAGKRALVETGTFFTDLKSSVDVQFAAAISHFSGQSLTQISTPASFRSRPYGLGQQVAAGIDTGSDAQNNWMMSKVTDNVGGSGALAPLSSSLPPNLFDDLWGAITAPSITADLNTALSDLNDFFATLFSDPKDLGSRGVSDLISAAQALVDFVIDLLDSIVSKIIDLVSTALGVAADILTQPLGEIPVVSWLYTNVVCPSDQQEQLSILRLACLVLALPVTLIYKAANSGNPPFDQATTNQILSWTFTPPGTPSAVRPDPATLGDPSVLAKVAAYLSLPQACADMTCDSLSVDGKGTLVQASGWFDVVVNWVILVLDWPDQPFDFSWDWPALSEAQRLSRSAWIVYFAPLLLNQAMLVLPEPEEGQVAQDDEPAGKTWLTMVGALILGLGLAGAIAGKSDDPPTTNDYGIAAAVLGPLPLITTLPLLLDAAVAASEEATVGIKLLIDAIGDIGAGFTALSGLS